MAVSDYSTTPGDNTTISGMTVTDATVANTLDNIIRQMMADIRAAYDAGVNDKTNVAITGGSISGITDLAVADGGTGASTAANARSNLGAQAQDAYLDDIAAMTAAEGDVMYFDGTDWQTLAIGTATQALKVNSGETAPEWAYAAGAPDFVASFAEQNSTGAIPIDTVHRNVLAGETVGASSIDLDPGTYFVVGEAFVRLTSSIGGAEASISLKVGSTFGDVHGLRGTTSNDSSLLTVKGVVTNAGPGDVTVSIDFARDNAGFEVSKWAASGHSTGNHITGYLNIWRLA